MDKLHLPIIVEIDEDGYYIVSCPLFKGCHSYGETIDEAMANIREVIDMCLEETKPEELNKFGSLGLDGETTVGAKHLQVRDVLF